MGACCNKDPLERADDNKEIHLNDPDKSGQVSERQSKPPITEETEDDIKFKLSAVNIKSPKQEINVTWI